ncbi:hypothetical protein JD844_031874, partial [Phrynosoma platyrhinos]
KLTEAIELKPDDAEYYCQRAYAHILLHNYHDAITDAKKALSLDPNNAIAFLRQGISEYHMKNYVSALKSLNEGQKLDGKYKDMLRQVLLFGSKDVKKPSTVSSILLIYILKSICLSWQ